MGRPRPESFAATGPVNNPSRRNAKNLSHGFHGQARINSEISSVTSVQSVATCLAFSWQFSVRQAHGSTVFDPEAQTRRELAEVRRQSSVLASSLRAFVPPCLRAFPLRPRLLPVFLANLGVLGVMAVNKSVTPSPCHLVIFRLSAFASTRRLDSPPPALYYSRPSASGGYLEEGIRWAINSSRIRALPSGLA